MANWSLKVKDILFITILENSFRCICNTIPCFSCNCQIIKHIKIPLQLHRIGLIDVVAVVAISKDFIKAAELTKVMLAALCINGE